MILTSKGFTEIQTGPYERKEIIFPLFSANSAISAVYSLTAKSAEDAEEKTLFMETIPEYTEEQIKEFRATFKKRRSQRITIFWFALIFLLVVGFLLLPLMDMLGVPRLSWAPFVYIVMFGVIALIAVVWRCPACNGLLGDIFNTKYCPKCGFNLNANDKK